jgi:hypothetical protein
MQYLVEITDKDGNSFQVRLKLASPMKRITVKNSTWKVVDEGYLKYRNGGCAWSHSDEGSFGPADLYLCVGDPPTWGVVLWQFFDTLTVVNDSGSGWIHPVWATGAKSGNMSWVLLD